MERSPDTKTDATAIRALEAAKRSGMTLETCADFAVGYLAAEVDALERKIERLCNTIARLQREAGK
jgi:ubiquinone biosynthesis protein UbiJ